VRRAFVIIMTRLSQIRGGRARNFRLALMPNTLPAVPEAMNRRVNGIPATAMGQDRAPDSKRATNLLRVRARLRTATQVLSEKCEAVFR
jgi:hypothetical protein